MSFLVNRRRGDTLIEVLFAVAIFSIIAIAIVATMNNGTSNVQSTLESTMARNEIDAQAEALRFIQSSYIAEKDGGGGSSTYGDLWKAIIARAKNPDENNVTNFEVSTCSDLYDKNKSGNIFSQNAFILNTKRLDSGTSAIVKDGYLRAASLYPRILFGADSDELIDTNNITSISAAEGIYIVAVSDNQGTTVIEHEGVELGTAYYDFYIRACWQKAGSRTASTTSTVIRLYNPDVNTVDYELTNFALVFNANGGNDNSVPDTLTYTEKAASHTFTIPTKTPTRAGYEFMGWSGNGQCSAVSLGGSNFGVSATDPIVTLKAIWECPFALYYSASGATNVPRAQEEVRKERNWYTKVSNDKPKKNGLNFWRWSYDGKYYYAGENGPVLTAPYNTSATLTAEFISDFTIYYDKNGDGIVPDVTVCTPNTTNDNAETQCVISSEPATRTGYKFEGWAESSSGAVKYLPGDKVKLSVGQTSITLYAKWRQQNDRITIKLSFASNDCDSHVKGWKSNGVEFHAYYRTKIGNDTDGTIIAQLDTDCTTGGTETFILNTTGGKSYYYYVHNYSGCPVSGYSSKVTSVTVSSANNDFAERTYYLSNASGTWGAGSIWNVFAYKDGRIVDKMTISGIEDISY